MLLVGIVLQPDNIRAKTTYMFLFDLVTPLPLQLTEIAKPNALQISIADFFGLPARHFSIYLAGKQGVEYKGIPIPFITRDSHLIF